MKLMLKRLLISFLLFAILATNFAYFAPSIVKAQGVGPWYGQTFQQWYTKVYDEDFSPPSEIFGERYTAAQVQWVVYGFFSFILNTLVGGNTKAITCVMNKALGDCISAIDEAINSLPLISRAPSKPNNALAIFSNRPVSLSEYFNEIKQKLRIVPEVKAQGFGFTAANPVLELWRLSRDVSYTLLVLVVIAIAFMIMFRVKISPQAVISVQSALPKIAAGIILITFSYAIAGFLIDLMYVVIGLVSLIVAGNISNFGWNEIFNAITVENNVLFLYIHYWFMFLIGFLVNTIAALVALNITTAIVSLIAILVAIILVLAILWFSIKTIWLLIKTYVQILLNIAFAPFQILVGMASPQGSTTGWMRTLAANLAVYPLVSILFILAFAFLRAGFPDGTVYDSMMAFNINADFFSGTPWHPPLTIGTSSEHGNRILWLFTSFAIIALIPKTAEIIKGMIERKPFPYGTAIGEAFGPVGAAGGGYGMYAATAIEKGRAPAPFGRILKVENWGDRTQKRVADLIESLSRRLR